MGQDPRLKKSRAALTLAALGIVYGDIGTSPLYAAKETFNPVHGIALNTENILGGLSAIFWSLMIVVSLKYVILIMRADNKGEGGIMALLALASSAVRDRPRWRSAIMLLGRVRRVIVLRRRGAYAGDLGAFGHRGPGGRHDSVQALCRADRGRRGGRVVRPAAAGHFGRRGAVRPSRSAVVPCDRGDRHPWHRKQSRRCCSHSTRSTRCGFVTQHGLSSFLVLGAVLLAFTGAEALYADMGHFGKAPIRIAWFGLVFPALVLNYFGQGALLIADPKAVENPFYLLAPDWALYPMVVLATAATVIASQATISGTYSLTKQAIQLDYLPRMNVMQTSAKESGQIYVPGANWVLLVVIIAAIIGFGSSTKLASAYGVAVSGTMLATTILTFFVIRFGWGYNLLLCIAATGFFILVDAAFFASSLLKIAEGGWFPLALGAIVFTVMTTWRRGREIAMAKQKRTGDAARAVSQFAGRASAASRARHGDFHGGKRRCPLACVVAELRVQQGAA